MSKKQYKRVVKTWDDFWAEFWRIRLVGSDEASDLKSQQVVEFCWKVLGIKRGQRVLDLGCGGGYQARYLAERGAKVHGIDITPVLIRHAAKHMKKHDQPGTFEVGDMRTFSVTEPFDHVVVLGMSFGFGTDVENAETLRRIYAALKPGGKLLLTGQHPYALSNHLGPEWLECDEGLLLHRAEFDPETSRLGGSWELATPEGEIIMEGENPEKDGVRCYTVPELNTLLTTTGFKEIESYGAWYLPPQPMHWFSMELIMSARKPK